jgi:hypothetical protein
MSIKIKTDQKGFTNIDIVVGIMILIFVLPMLMNLVRDTNIKSIEYEVYDKGTIYANTIMHYITGFRFDENYGTTGTPWTYPLGQDGGDYDDIDDFINMDWSIIPGLASSGYTATSNVFYVDPYIDLNTPQSIQTHFKRIVVSVNHDMQSNPITITTLITAHEF